MPGDARLLPQGPLQTTAEQANRLIPYSPHEWKIHVMENPDLVTAGDGAHIFGVFSANQITRTGLASHPHAGPFLTSRRVRFRILDPATMSGI